MDWDLYIKGKKQTLEALEYFDRIISIARPLKWVIT